MTACLPHKEGAWCVSDFECVCLTGRMLWVFPFFFSFFSFSFSFSFFLCLSVCLTRKVLGVFPSLSLSVSQRECYGCFRFVVVVFSLSVCLPHKEGSWCVSVFESVCLTRRMLCVFGFLCLSHKVSAWRVSVSESVCLTR